MCFFKKENNTNSKEFLKDNKLEINLSAGKVNYSQLNNLYIHKNVNGDVDVSNMTMCNVTSLVQSLDYNGWKFPEGEFQQPEDNLAKFILESEDVKEYFKTRMPILYKDWIDGKQGAYTPNEIHDVLAFGVNKWLDQKVDTFKENAKIWDIVKEILEGRSCVISGAFPTVNGKKLNHIVSLVGGIWEFNTEITTAEATNKILNEQICPNYFIIDDPYAFWNTIVKQYEYDRNGDNVKVSYQDFIDYIKPVNNSFVKYCHFLKSGASIV